MMMMSVAEARAASARHAAPAIPARLYFRVIPRLLMGPLDYATLNMPIDGL